MSKRPRRKAKARRKPRIVKVKLPRGGVVHVKTPGAVLPVLAVRPGVVEIAPAPAAAKGWWQNLISG